MRWLFHQLRYSIALGAVVIFFLVSCIEPFQPPTVAQDVDLLVVDGYLNAADGQAVVTLSHALSLSTESGVVGEQNATVSIVDQDGTTYPLNEGEAGTYVLSGLPINPGAKYRLSIHTSNNFEYSSDYVERISTPAIDSVTWTGDDDGLTVLVTTHDPAGVALYYRWDYIETWQYHAAVSSDFKLEGKTPVYRTDAERIYTCWRDLPSTRISISSSLRLAEDVIHEYPIRFIPKGSDKISVKYSILVKQRAVSKKEFEFLEQLQKTTESLGGLFDPQPSQVSGNMHNLSDPTQPVLGYFSMGSSTEQRLFIDYNDLPDPLKVNYRDYGCTPDTVKVADLPNISSSDIIGTAIYQGPFIVAYTRSWPSCADCRTKGGSLTKPPFWP